MNVPNHSDHTSFQDRISTVTETGKRNWIYASKPSGKWYTNRQNLAYLYLIIFFVMPFIKVNGQPFLLINVIEGKFILFSKVFWPQDFFIFALLMIISVVFIIIFTLIYGRIFCGWVCPQTIFLEFVFRPIEWLIEGSPTQQKKLLNDNSKSKWVKKIGKHSLYIIISLVISHTFLSYILGVDKVLSLIQEPYTNNIGLFSGLMIFTALFYFVFSHVREIVCTTVCPYGRLQGLMTDKDTFQVTYDYKRGEPRASLKKATVRVGGDCINCFKCVQVCPTGIDIRNGTQMECVGCTACIDACDEVMDAIQFEKGLIRYASENEILTGKKFEWTSKIKAYTAVLFVLLIGLGFMIVSRKQVDITINRASGQLYQVLENGMVSNLFELNIMNKSNDTLIVDLQSTFPDIKIIYVGYDSLTVYPNKINSFTFFAQLPKDNLKSYSTQIEFEAYAKNQLLDRTKTIFLGPFNSNK